MSKKEIVLVAAVLVLGGIYAVYFTGVFKKPRIEIIAQIRPAGVGLNRHHRRQNEEAPVEPLRVDPVSFTLDDRYELTALKVVVDEEYQTNKYAHAVWHLVSQSNSVPTKGIIYGMKIRGMEPDVPKARPEPLQPNVTYRLLVDAGQFKGEKTFKTREAVHPASP